MIELNLKFLLVNDQACKLNDELHQILMREQLTLRCLNEKVLLDVSLSSSKADLRQNEFCYVCEQTLLLYWSVFMYLKSPSFFLSFFISLISVHYRWFRIAPMHLIQLTLNHVTSDDKASFKRVNSVSNERIYQFLSKCISRFEMTKFHRSNQKSSSRIQKSSKLVWYQTTWYPLHTLGSNLELLLVILKV